MIAPTPPEKFEVGSGIAIRVSAHGFVGDGCTLNTAVLQRAIDGAHGAGGGTVRISPGIYLTGTLELRSRVRLHLEKGATLLGSPRIADYGRGNWPALIMARGQNQVAISGEGTIDGQGALLAADTRRINEAGTFLDFFPGLKPGEKIETFAGIGKSVLLDPYELFQAGQLGERVFPKKPPGDPEWRAQEFVRPQILEFWACRQVLVSGVYLRNAACWVQTYRDCTDVQIEGIRVESMAYWNNDGIDLVDCRRVAVSGCEFNAADDGICLKSDAPDRGCEDVTVSHCRVRTSANAIKFGTGSYSAFKRVKINDIEVYDTFRSAVALEVVDGGWLEDVQISRVRARNTGNALFLRIGQRAADRPPGRLRRVLLEDIEVEVPAGQPDLAYEHPGPPIAEAANVMPSSVTGLPGHPVEDVTIRNLSIHHAGGGRREVAEVALHRVAEVPDRPALYPEFSMFGELPAWGLYLRHATGIRLENVRLKAQRPDYRAAIVADDVNGFSCENCHLDSAGAESVVALRAVSGFQAVQLSAGDGCAAVIRRI